MTALDETLAPAISSLPKMPAVPPMRMAACPPAAPATLPADPQERLAALFDPKTPQALITSQDEGAGQSLCHRRDARHQAAGHWRPP